MSNIAIKKNRFVDISLLRIASMLAVFAVHFGQRMHLQGFIRVLTNCGQYGVQLFFVISGFLMIHSLDKCTSGKDIIQFYIKKCIRLLVLYYLIVLWYFVSETFIFHDIVPDEYHLGWARYLFLLNGIVPGGPYLWANVGITWTIPLFFMAYLITPVFYKSCKLNNTLKLSALFLGLIVLHLLQIKFFGGWLSFFKYYYTFVGGMLVYKAFEEGKQTIVAILSFASMIPFLVISLEVSVSLFAVIILIVTQLVFERVKIKNEKLLKIINTIDSYSYTLYLGHGIIFCSILDKFNFDSRVLICSIAVLGSIVLTYLLYHFYEKPVTNLLQKKLLTLKTK